MTFRDHPSTELFLRRLMGNSGVVLLTTEFGSHAPISTDPAVCAQFFKPWFIRNSARYMQGRFALEAPLARIVAAGYSAEVLRALKQVPTWMIKSLTWPHSVLRLLVADDLVAAKAHLSAGLRWTLSGPADWEAAGIYWAVFFNDRDMARVYFEKAVAAQPHRLEMDQATLAWDWLRLCDNTDCALLCLYGAMDSGPYGGSDDDMMWQPMIALAEAWMTLFNRKDWAGRYLEYASAAGTMHCVSGLFPAAIAWMCILQDEKRATALAEQAMGDKREALLSAPLYWCCIADDREKARKCLWSKEWSDYQSARFRLRLAQGIVMFQGVGDIQTSLGHAEALICEVTREKQTDIWTQCAAAELWSNVSGPGAEDLLVTAEAQAEETCGLLEIAETWRRLTHLSAETCLSGARKVLEHAEQIAAHPMDYYFCANSWKTVVGDEESTERCLLKGEAGASNTQEISLLAQCWTTMLGRPARTRKLILEKSRTILPKESAP